MDPKTKKPTKRQLELLKFFAGYEERHGYAPAVRDFVNYFGFRSTNAAADHIKSLVRGGWLTKTPRVARSLNLTIAGFDVVEGHA